MPNVYVHYNESDIVKLTRYHVYTQFDNDGRLIFNVNNVKYDLDKDEDYRAFQQIEHEIGLDIVKHDKLWWQIAKPVEHVFTRLKYNFTGDVIAVLQGWTD